MPPSGSSESEIMDVVFAINGHNSVTPHPAGSYKKLDSTEEEHFVMAVLVRGGVFGEKQ